MKLFGFVLAILALIFAVVSGMSVGEKPAGLNKGPEKAGCQGGPGGPGGPPPPRPTNATG